ncbi:MAG: DUF1559 domain-containing protein [Planctomycetia bacterium]|nr:DUF1559 domain-containing protein [Planctomycetia bacterium]
MPISFICPHCGRHTDVSEKFAGMTGPCAGCGRPVAIPSVAEWQEQKHEQPAGKGAVGLAVGGLIAVVLCLLAAAFVVPTLLRLQTQAQLGTTETNLKVIAGAMQAYHDVWGSFPPAVTLGPDGSPYHSWRVLLLPYLERDDLYVRYNLREPWDSPNNRSLARLIPDVYSNGTPDGQGRTQFVVVIGERTMFPPGTTTSRADAIKGMGGTVLVVESSYSPVEWIAPEDLAFDSMSFKINDSQGTSLSGDQPEGALVAFVDGSTALLSEQTTSEPAVQSLLLRDASPFGGSAAGVAAIYAPAMDITRMFEPVSFTELANQGIHEDLHGGRAGNNLGTLNPGEQVLGGVNFNVPDRVLCLGHKDGTAAHFPDRIDGIEIGETCERLHFLHATGWPAPKDGVPIGHYEVHYADGGVEMMPIVYGVDVRDWWDADGTKAVDRGRMVWTGSNQAIGQQSPGAPQIRLFLTSWDNPRPETPIETIDYVSYRETECAPFCVAITIDNPRDRPEEKSSATTTPEEPPTPANAFATPAEPAATSESPASTETTEEAPKDEAAEQAREQVTPSESTP